jgi:hypothetical protein
MPKYGSSQVAALLHGVAQEEEFIVTDHQPL